MSGIPIYTQSPIKAAKPSGVTPQTAVPASVPQSSGIPFATTTALQSSSPYPTARPGATASLPAPTGAVVQRYAPIQPTRTAQSENNGPPAPQPAAVPMPSSMSSIPPRPKFSEKFYPPQQTAAPQAPGSTPQPYPPQMTIPPPASNICGHLARSTAMSNTSSSAYPVALLSFDNGVSRPSLEHPPGYHQNVYASELTSEQRRAMEVQNTSSFEGHSNSDNAGALESDNSMWNSLGKIAQQAGVKMAKVEEDIWRKINKD